MKTAIIKDSTETKNHGLNRKAYLGKLAQDLLYLSSNQVSRVYAHRGLLIPVETSSTLDFLYQHQSMSLSDVSNALDVPFQLAAQRVAKLMELGLLFKNPDQQDKRRSLLQLSASGIHQAELLQQCMCDVEVVYSDLYREIACDLPTKLQLALDALKTKPLTERFEENF